MQTKLVVSTDSFLLQNSPISSLISSPRNSISWKSLSCSGRQGRKESSTLLLENLVWIQPIVHNPMTFHIIHNPVSCFDLILDWNHSSHHRIPFTIQHSSKHLYWVCHRVWEHPTSVSLLSKQLSTAAESFLIAQEPLVTQSESSPLGASELNFPLAATIWLQVPMSIICYS